MMFRFDIKVNDQDYLDFHKFWLARSPYGKEQMRSSRITVTFIFVICMLVLLFLGNFSVAAFFDTIPLLIALILMQVFHLKLFFLLLKRQIKSLKKTGKMGYSPESAMEFHKDCFVEITPDNKVEHKYSAVERVSVVENKVVYVHINNITAYILPFSSFASEAQFGDFLAFIKTKCTNIDVY